MSELIAEARVLVTPDTTTFRTLLATELAAISKTIPPVPVQIVPARAGAIDTSGAVRSMDAVGNAVRGSDDALKKFDTTARNTGRGLAQAGRGAGAASLSFLGLRGATLAAGGAFLSGAAAIAVLGKSIGSAAQLETSLNTFQVTAEATADEMERVSDVSKELGADLTLPGVTANSAADALAQLSRAGLSVDDSIDGVRGTLQLATAAALDNETAVLLVAGALNAFRLEGVEAARVADLLAAASKESQGSIEDMGLSLQQAAAAAAQAGISVEDTIAILTQLGRAGLRGSDAGTSLRTAILRVINPSKQAKEALEGLGVEIRDIEGNVRPEVFAEIASQAAKLGPAQRDATIALIGGQDAFRAISILGRDGAQRLDEMRVATQEVGVAAKLASARTKGLAGSAENLKNQFQTLGITIGGAASGPLQTFVDSMAQAVSGLNTFVGFLGDLGSETPRAERSIAELADEFQRLNEEAGGRGTQQQAVQRVEGLGKAAAVAVLEYAELTEEVGKANAEVAKGAEKGFVSRAAQAELDRLNDELREVQSEGVKAAGVIEDFKLGLDAAAGAAEGLGNRIDESFDRFAQPLPEPTAPPGKPRKRVSQLEGQAQLAESEGNLAEAERIREQILANAIKAEKAGIHKGVRERQRLFDERVAAEVRLNNLRKQRAAAAAAKGKQAAKDVAKDTFLEDLATARQRQENVVAAAAITPGVRDDLRENQQLRALLQSQIRQIRGSKLDESEKKSVIEVLTAAVIATTGAIKRLTDARNEQRDAEKAEREANRQAIRDRTIENAALRTQIAEARGASTKVIVQFIDQQIEVAKVTLRQAIQAGKGVLAAKLALEQLREKKRDLLKAAEDIADDDKGTTAFDLLTQAAGRFTGGNLIGAAQPFAGPTEFTADLSQFLRRQQTTTTTTTARATTDQFSGFRGSADRLVTAIDRNTAALTGGEAGPPKRKGTRPPVSGAIDRNDRRWRDAAQARETIEGAG